MTLEIGSLLYNRYRIDAVIAQGGMGAIYRAFDQSLGVQVALKENLFETEESARQFHREATLLAGMRHSHLPRVTDHFAIPNQGQYLVMDFIEGEDLRQRLVNSGTMREDDVITIGAAVCEALQYLHSRVPPIVHRDIKPGNIKVTPNGQVFLVDFGLAKVSSPGQATTTGAQALTPGYAPPEQYGQGTSPISDIYSLGATLYAVLTGKIPEDGLARAMNTAQLTPIRKYNPQVSERTSQVLEKAMSVRPEDRYPSGAAFRMALLNTPTAIAAHLGSGEASQPLVEINSSEPTLRRSEPGLPNTQQFPTVATPQIAAAPSSPIQPTPSKRSFPILWILIGLLAIVVVITASFFLLQQPFAQARPSETPPAATAQPTQPPATAVLAAATIVPSATVLPSTTFTPPPPTPTLSPTPAASATRSMTATAAATSLGGGSGQITFASIQTGKLPQIWLINADGTKPQALTQIEDGACQPSWSPDGKRLVFVTPCARQQDEYPGSILFLINADGSNPEPLPSLPGGDFDPAWSPDGTKIAFTSQREGTDHIFTIDLASHKVERLTGAFYNDRRPVWSSDGKKIAFESTRLGTRQAWLMNANGENPAEFTRLAEGPAFNPIWSKDGNILYYNREVGLPVIFARRTDVSQPTETRLVDLRPVQRPRISSDGQWIVFETWTGSNHDLVIMRSSGTNRQAVTNDSNYDFDPVWKP